MSFGSGMIGGTVARRVITETSSDGTTIEYREDTAARVPMTVTDAHVSDLQIVLGVK